MHFLGKLKTKIINVLKKFFYRNGYFLVRNNYYCPIPDKEILKNESKRWYKENKLIGIDISVEYMQRFIEDIFRNNHEYFNNLYKTRNEISKFGPGYGIFDNLILSGIILYFKPNKIVEVGSGISTYYGTKALKQNKIGEYTCIEPYPYHALRSLPLIKKIIDKRIELVDLKIFSELKRNDIFFIDSSHTVKIGGDIEYIYGEILPILNKGVIVHIHDIAWPYPIWKLEQVTEGNRMWTEYIVVQAFLSFNKEYEILLSSSYLHYKHPDVLEKYLPFYKRNMRPPVSLWISRK